MEIDVVHETIIAVDKALESAQENVKNALHIKSKLKCKKFKKVGEKDTLKVEGLQLKEA